MSSTIKIVGVDVPANKVAWCSLAYIYGIGYTLARNICAKNDIDCNKRIKDLSDLEIDKIRKYIEANYIVEGELRQEISRNIKRFLLIKCYKGLRHKLGLPVRGQRTKTNARTRKGRGGKKKVK
ncbi:30S ribosomal protein S13 [Candidatus Deianiraea vastatrix]|uniref:Small ribosomal subunit protein uS13 n=1 Tax=Candidatus Deianiraea vastatrix TaxID=2163644 RepID=A0A5B8XH93_9RICK|nr:30S ribosomal protein S13 [Candidatus Deianiraea vastatrix]QED23207.1 30S ribosomal protein S13 [Candidatus Deianiraea vastatrix]